MCAPSGVEPLLRSAGTGGIVERVTTSTINPHAMGQGEIDEAVRNTLKTGLSLYGLREELLRDAKPDVVLTQTLCSVCAVDEAEVARVCRRLGLELAPDDTAADAAGTTNAAAAADDDVADAGANAAADVDAAAAAASAAAAVAMGPAVHSFEPSNLKEVAASFESIATACGVPERGATLKATFERQLREVSAAVQPSSFTSSTSTAVASVASSVSSVSLGTSSPPPTMLLIEWLQPPFDGGHWVPDQVDVAGCRNALNESGAKSKERTWDVRWREREGGEREIERDGD